MQNFFTGICSTIRGLIGKLQATMNHMSFEIGCVAYRDVKDKARFEIHNFSGSISKFEQFLESIHTTGGNDQCEDVLGGLAKAAEFNFRFANRVLILCGDAPCHGSKYHDGCGDDFPDGKFNGAVKSKSIIKKLIKKGIDTTFLKINEYVLCCHLLLLFVLLLFFLLLFLYIARQTYKIITLFFFSFYNI